MKLKPILITTSIMIGVASTFFINIAGKPLIAWILFAFAGLFCITFIFMEIYNILTDGPVDGQFP